MLACGFLEVYVSLLTLGKDFKCHREKMFSHKCCYEEAAGQRTPLPWGLCCSPEGRHGENSELYFTCTVYTARAACACWVQKPNNTRTLGTYCGHLCLLIFTAIHAIRVP